MYILINKTTRNTEIISGGWPGEYVNELLNEGNKLIVISLRSNTIKIPVGHDNDGHWDKWEEYKLPDLMVLMKCAADYKAADYKSLPYNL
jgi:hypothetical protein